MPGCPCKLEMERLSRIEGGAIKGVHIPNVENCSCACQYSDEILNIVILSQVIK